MHCSHTTTNCAGFATYTSNAVSCSQHDLTSRAEAFCAYDECPAKEIVLSIWLTKRYTVRIIHQRVSVILLMFWICLKPSATAWFQHAQKIPRRDALPTTSVDLMRECGKAEIPHRLTLYSRSCTVTSTTANETMRRVRTTP